MSIEDIENENNQQQSLDDLVIELAAMKPLEYEQVRDERAKQYKVRAAVLDKEVSKARNNNESTATQGSKIELLQPEPWPVQIELSETLDEAAGLIINHMVMREEDSWACVLFAAHTHLLNKFNHTPRLLIDAPDFECGKTLLMTHMVGSMVVKPLSVELMNPAPFFRLAEIEKPTFLLDEMDVFIKEDSNILAAVNNGWEPQGGVLRCVEPDNEVRLFSTHCPVAMAGIRLSEKLPHSTVSRSVVINLDRASEDDLIDKVQYDAKIHKKPLLDIGRKLARFIQDNKASIIHQAPNLPDGVKNRMSDKWGPLFSIANVAGGHWPARAKKAMTVTRQVKEPTRALMLLADIKSILEPEGLPTIESLHTTDLIDELCKLEDSPWPDYNYKNGDPERRRIQPRQIYKLLGAYKVHKRQVKRLGSNKQGFHRSSFIMAWERYLNERAEDPENDPSPPSTPSESATLLQTSNSNGFSGNKVLPDSEKGSTKNGLKASNSLKGSKVAPFQGGAPGEGKEKGPKRYHEEF